MWARPRGLRHESATQVHRLGRCREPDRTHVRNAIVTAGGKRGRPRQGSAERPPAISPAQAGAHDVPASLVRNERTKLTAIFLNTTGGCFTAGAMTPMVAMALTYPDIPPRHRDRHSQR